MCTWEGCLASDENLSQRERDTDGMKEDLCINEIEGKVNCGILYWNCKGLRNADKIKGERENDILEL